MNGAGRRRGDFYDSVNRANICAVPAWNSDVSCAAPPYMGRCELTPTTAIRTHAQTKYSKRFLDAYGPHRSQTRLLHQPPTTNPPAPSNAKPHDAGRNSTPRLTSDRRPAAQSRSRQSVSRATMSSVTALYFSTSPRAHKHTFVAVLLLPRSFFPFVHSSHCSSPRLNSRAPNE